MEFDIRYNQNLRALCIAEFFSSSAYFGMLSLLILFFINMLQIPQKESYSLIGNFVGVSMIMALAGGLIGSRYLSARLCCLFGFVGYVIGYFLLLDYNNMLFLYLGLSLVSAGFGLFEPNIQILFGAHFDTSTDQQRNIGFIVFYIFNILGQFFGAILLTYLGIINEHIIFLVTGIFSFIGLIYISIHYKKFNMPAITPNQNHTKQNSFFDMFVFLLLFIMTFCIIMQARFPGIFGLPFLLVGSATIIIVALIVRGLLGTNIIERSTEHHDQPNTLIGVFSVILVFALSFYTILQYHVKELFEFLLIPISIFFLVALFKAEKVLRNKIISLFILFFGALVAVLCLRVCFGTIDLFTKHYVNENLFGWHVHTALFGSTEKIFIILIFSGIISIMRYFSNHNISLSAGTLVSFGLLMLAICFGCLALGISASASSKMSVGWLLLCYFFMAIGELCVIPVIISAVISHSGPFLLF